MELALPVIVHDEGGLSIGVVLCIPNCIIFPVTKVHANA